MTDEELKFAGQVAVELVQIIKPGQEPLDITNMVDGITLYEDLFSPFHTGQITVRDTLELPNVFGRSGDDILRLVMSTPELPEKYAIDNYYLIYKMADKTIVKDRMQTYNLYFSSIEQYSDLNTRISKLQSENGEVIIQELMAGWGTAKPLDFDATANYVQYVSNFWSPTKNIAYICEHSESDKEENIGGYLFYEDRIGFNFKDVSSLACEDVAPIQEFTKTDFSANIELEGINAGYVSRDPDEDYKGINAVRVDTNYDYIRDVLDGAIATKIYTNDVVSKVINWDYYNAIGTLAPKMNPSPLYRDDTIGNTGFAIMSVNRGYGTFGTSDITNHKLIQQRIGFFRTLQQSKIEIDVYGRFDYTVGKKVKVTINQMRGISKDETEEEIKEKVLSGFYVITGMSHTINKEKHFCTLELCKDSTLLLV